MSERIIIVDDDPTVSSFMQEYLEANGYRAAVAGDGKGLRRALRKSPANLLILDVMLPGENGLEITRWVRAESNVPIIMLTGRGETVDRVVGLELGADDYMAKPFEPRELLARVRSVLRRSRLLAAKPGLGNDGSVAKFASWHLDLKRRRIVSASGAEEKLTAAEFDLLVTFVTHPDRVLSREQLLDLAFGRDMEAFDRSIDVLVMRLRRHIEEDRSDPALIRTVRGAGYIFTPEVEWS